MNPDMAAPAPDAHRSVSDILLALVRTHPEDRITVRALLEGLGERGFGFAFILFSIPAAMPGPPGFGSLFGIPLMYFAAQMILRMKAPWLPAFIAERSFGRADLEKIIVYSVPYLRRIERLCKPRAQWLLGGVGEVLLGILIFILAFVLFLPGPGTNFLPGLSILFLAIALIERDGVLVMAGVVLSFVLMSFAIAGIWIFIDQILPAMISWTVDAWSGLVGLFGG